MLFRFLQKPSRTWCSVTSVSRLTRLEGCSDGLHLQQMGFHLTLCGTFRTFAVPPDWLWTVVMGGYRHVGVELNIRNEQLHQEGIVKADDG